MGSTYLELVNKVLRRLNEVEISESDFPSVKGIHALAKDAVKDAINAINTNRTEWPFNAYEHSITLQPGVEEYPWPENYSAADWDSFQIQKSDTFNIRSRTLVKINRDQWYKYRKDLDDDSLAVGIDEPKFVSESHGRGFLVTPSPDKQYQLKYRYYINSPELENFDDKTTIPTKYDYVIATGAMYFVNMFKGDTEATDRAGSKFQEYIKDMVLHMFPIDQYIYNTMVSNKSPYSSTRMWTGFNP